MEYQGPKLSLPEIKLDFCVMGHANFWKLNVESVTVSSLLGWLAVNSIRE